MRRAGLGDGAAAGSYGYTNSGYSVYEEENDRLTESLRTKVSAIKSHDKFQNPCMSTEQFVVPQGAPSGVASFSAMG
ncbi:hypothetical protein DUI87_18185 [Hirundo rustica rustica]|uniref:Uncharacterized protein n=1 Tax=Hirundo rustica rustica TaxID=333673 RepID=A0A3M0JW83_HIRRU|nr:hypothetical protein DUI87_18185 [Hirundo rustica rustica]